MTLIEHTPEILYLINGFESGVSEEELTTIIYLLDQKGINLTKVEKKGYLILTPLLSTILSHYEEEGFVKYDDKYSLTPRGLVEIMGLKKGFMKKADEAIKKFKQ